LEKKKENDESQGFSRFHERATSSNIDDIENVKNKGRFISETTAK